MLPVPFKQFEDALVSSFFFLNTIISIPVRLPFTNFLACSLSLIAAFIAMYTVTKLGCVSRQKLGDDIADMAYASDNVMQMWNHLILINQILSLRCPTCEVLIQLIVSCYCVAAMVWLYVVRKFFN